MARQKVLEEEYNRRYVEWIQEDEEEQKRPERIEQEIRYRIIFEATFKELSKQRGDKERQIRKENRIIGGEYLSVTNQVVDKRKRNAVDVPPIICKRARKRDDRFYGIKPNQTDVVGEERKRIKDFEAKWTEQELETFCNRLKAVGKNFANISMFLPGKTVKDCVQFYYLFIKRHNGTYKSILPRWKRTHKRKYKAPVMPTPKELLEYEQAMEAKTDKPEINISLCVDKQSGRDGSNGGREGKYLISVCQSRFKAKSNSINKELDIVNRTLEKLQQYGLKRKLLNSFCYSQMNSDNLEKLKSSDRFIQLFAESKKELASPKTQLGGLSNYKEKHIVVNREMELANRTSIGLQKFNQRKQIFNQFTNIQQTSTIFQLQQILKLNRIRTLLKEKEINLKKELQAFYTRQ